MSSGSATWNGTEPPPFVEVSGHTGGFSTRVPIDVPSFRGLEPSLSLVYGSSGGSGFAGVGWSVSGFSDIERRSADGGWPKFNSADTYWLDGQKLVPCGGSASPGCDSGGTHFTETETYLRIVEDGTDSWTVTSRNGVESAYSVMGFTGTRKFRWGLTSRTDTLGNEVSYTWACASETDYCYPATVAYNGALVTLYRETRPDPVSGPAHVIQYQRLKTVDVTLSGLRVRAYKLLYSSSASTERSLLSSVTVYGTDAVVSGSGVISSGSSLPPTSFTYRTDAQYASFTGGGLWNQEWCWEGNGTEFGEGDFNGDGKDDVYCHYAATWNNETLIGLSNGTGAFGAFQSVLTGWCDAMNATFATGDFNADGFTDFACQRRLTPFRTEVALNDGDGTFSPPVAWTTNNFCDATLSNSSSGLADVNGDGKTDVWCHRGSSQQDAVWVGVSTGTSFQESQWQSSWCWTVDAFFQVGPDVNGDGNGDAVCRGVSSGFVDVALSTGTSFGTSGGFPTLTYFCGSGLTFGAGDFNADGKSDLWCRQPENNPDRVRGMYVAMSKGDSWTGWTSATDYSAAPYWCSGAFQVSTGDLNGDGRSDLLCHNRGTGYQTWVILSNDHEDGFSASSIWLDNWCSDSVRLGDQNGDGKTDILCHVGNNTWVAVAGGLRGDTDVLTQIAGSMGGTTTIAYKPSSDWANQNNPPVRETAISVTVNDGRGWQTATTYEYSGGKIDREKGRDLGFAQSKTILPKLSTETTAPYSESWFSQTIASAGALTKSERRDGAGKIFHKTENTIAIDGDGTTEPYRARVTQRWSYVYNGTVTGCGSWPCTNGERRYEEYDYDDWGNMVVTRSWGNYDVMGDETTSIAEFYPSASTYVTGRTARQASYVGIGTAGTKLSESRIFYDGATQHTMSPTDGLLTKTSVWRNTDNQFVTMCNLSSCVQYDPFGNVTKTTDVKGGETTLVYEPTYDLFPTSTTNALGHVSSMTWNYRCEGVATATNPSIQTTTTTYDVFCRHDRTDGPLGSYADSLYQNFGNPATQHVEVQGPSPNGSGVSWSRAYMDGLGRSYKRENRGPTVGQEILSGEVTFNQRGGVLTSTATRYTGGTAQVTSYEYDSLDRLKKTTLPDLNTVTQSYGLRETYVTNPEGDITGEARNETGLVRYLIEYLGATPIVTSVTTNLTNRTETTQDYLGNTWATQVNSLGQATWISDPDSGTETREYNNVGVLTAVTNILNERTEASYDLLGRLTTRTTRAGTGGAQVTTFAYDQPRTGYFNKGFPTTMTDNVGTLKSDFDALGRPTRSERAIDGVPYVSTSAYNTAGLPSSRTYADTQTISWTYDAAGRLSTETGTITASTYDAAGRVLGRWFSNGAVTTQSYSATRGWIENIQTVKGSTVLQNLAYQYYPDGMIQAITSEKTMESWTYAYDDLNRLLAAMNVDTPSLTQSFTYNEIGNITYNSQIGTYAYPGSGNPRPHAVSTAGSRTYQYNAAGQMTSRNGTVIQWNGDGKPSSIGSVAFVYDGLGTRLKKTSGGQTTKNVGNDYEIAPDGTVTKYLAGGKQVGTSFFIHHRDHLGSIQAVTDAAGAEVRRQKHKPFGDQHTATGTHFESRGWIGEREEETELVYLNARYYDPEIGRFTAPDPIVRLGQGLNRYSYSWNNPINFLDPSGLDPAECNGMTEDECNQYIIDHPVDTLAGFCEENPRSSLCNGFISLPTDDGGNAAGNDVDCAMLPGHPNTPCSNNVPEELWPPAPTPPEPSPDPPVNNGPTPDNPLYNCQNGLKPNCRGNRAGTGSGGVQSSPSVIRGGGGGIGHFFSALGHFALGVAGKIWASPNTLLGLVLGLAGVPFGADIGFGNGAIQFTNYPWGANLGRALTLGNVQIYVHGNLPTDTDFLYGSSTRLSLGHHEQGHTVLSQILGPAFLPLYFLSGGLPDNNHPFELAANEYARGGSPWPW